jgi:hypothetical protein
MCILYQGHGKSLWYMQGMFRSNGGCGYVKKPDFLMEKGSHNECFDPKRALPAKTTLKVRYYLRRKSIHLVTYFENSLLSTYRLKYIWEMGGAQILAKHTLIHSRLQTFTQR